MALQLPMITEGREPSPFDAQSVGTRLGTGEDKSRARTLFAGLRGHRVDREDWLKSNQEDSRASNLGARF